jgi:hypothetical protein
MAGWSTRLPSPHAAPTGVRRGGVQQGRLPSRSTSGPGRLVPRTDYPRAPWPYPVPGGGVPVLCEPCTGFRNATCKEPNPPSTATHTGSQTPRGRLRRGPRIGFAAAPCRCRGRRTREEVALAGKRRQKGLPVASGPATRRQCLPGRSPSTPCPGGEPALIGGPRPNLLAWAGPGRSRL